MARWMRHNEMRTEAPLTIRIPSPLCRNGKTPQIQHLTHGQIEEASRILRDAQLGEVSRIGARQLALGDIRIRAGKVVVVVAGEPGIDRAGGDETDVDGDRGGDADLEAACCTHWVGGVEDVSEGLRLAMRWEGAVDGTGEITYCWD